VEKVVPAADFCISADDTVNGKLGNGKVGNGKLGNGKLGNRKIPQR